MSYRFSSFRPFCAAVLFAGLAIVGPMPAWAQAGDAPVADTRRHYAIQSGTLDQALNRFASTSGIMLVIDGSLTAGMSSQGLTGSYNVREGLAALLASSGLEAVVQANGSYALRRSSGQAMLPEVRVTAIADDGTTEGTGSYTTTSMSTATGLPLSIRETPQSVTVITRERMDDQALTKARDVLENTPGIVIQGTAPYRESFFSRGIEVSSYMFDGLPVTTNDSRAGTFMNDMAMYDRVEIVRGAAGLMQGMGSPSAAINFVRKRPTAEFQASIEGRLASWNHQAIEADVSGALNEARTLRARTVAVAQNSDSFQDVVTEDRKLFYVIAEADIARNTLLTVGYSTQDNKNNTAYSGLPTAPDGSDLNLPRSTYLGNTWNHWNDKTTSFFANLEHRFENDWKARFAFNRMKAEQDQLRAGTYWNDTDNRWDMSGGHAEVESRRTSYDLNVEGPYELFGRQHELILGGGSRQGKESHETAGYAPIMLATDIDIYNWNHDAPKPATFVKDFFQYKNDRQNGIYTATRLNIADPLKLILGLRADWYEYEVDEDAWWQGVLYATHPDTYEHKRHLTKYGGLIFNVDENHSVYTSYTDIFQPQNDFDYNKELLDPIVGKNYEVGVKGEYFGRRLNASASVFRVDQDNLAVAHPCAYPVPPGTGCQRASGLIRSEGYDLEIQGALTPNWQVGAGYTYVKTEVKEDSDPANIGTNPNSHMPTHQLKLATTYRMPDGKWRFGGALRWQGDVYSAWPDYDFRAEQDDYTVVDAMVGYMHDRHLDFQFNVSNLFDETYYSSIQAQPAQWGGNAIYGAPRRLLFSARYTF